MLTTKEARGGRLGLTPEADRSLVDPAGAGAAGASSVPKLLLAVVVFSALARFAWIGAFPLIEADEGLWTNSTKNFLRFGDWFMDGRTHVFLSPVFHALTLPAFAIGGASIESARIVSAVAGVISVLLLYRIVLQETQRAEHALVAAIVLGASHWAILTSRKAMIESLELCLILAAADFLVRRRAGTFAAAGLVLGLALLTKLNAVFILPVVGLYLLIPASSTWRGSFDRSTIVGRIGVAAVPLVIAIAIAAIVYGALYAARPVQFTSAFQFELDGVHFESISHPLIRVGRFGLDPLQEARTIIELFRDSPFVMVLAVLGAAVAVVDRTRGSRLFALWLIVGLPFFLGQMLQPVRYFYLLMPAFAYFAALAMLSLGTRRSATSGMGIASAAVVTVFVVFELAYAGASAASNRERSVPTVRQWAAAATSPNDAIMAAGFFCTDLPNRAYAHYRLARDTAQLFRSIREYNIHYVVVDNAEWRPDLRAAVEAKFERVAAWPFGAAYRVARE